MDISDRKKQTLRYIVEAYISGGEPVGSKYLTDSKQLPWSSATVRNDMMELERCGYLYQPHTSAGRIPTTAGYQAYVNELMEEYKMTASEVEAINKLLTFKLSELDKIVHNMGKIASHLSNYTAVTMQPKEKGAFVKRFEIMKLDEKNFVLIMITSTELVKSSHLHSSFDITDDDAELIKSSLNRYIAGLTPEDINLPIISKLERSVGSLSSIITPIIRVINEALTDIDDGSIEFEGVTNLLKYPEFSDNEALNGIINLPNEKDRLIELLSEENGNGVQTADGVNIIIGSEETSSPIKDYSIVYKSFDAGQGLKGTLAIIGPKRMEYGKVVAHLKYLTSRITQILPPPDMQNDSKEQ